MEEGEVAKESLAKRIAGEIVLSSNAGQTIQKWRNIFKIPQRTLADQLDIMPSVVSDYENGRRLSPGIKIIKRMVDAMISLDEKTGGKVIHEFSNFPTKQVRDTVASMKEFDKPSTVEEFCKKIGATLVARKDLIQNKLYGYTVVDALKVIVEFSPTEMVKLYGLTNERALIFMGAHSGRSSMVALKVTNLRPGLVVLQTKDTEIDALAKRIAEGEGIPVAIINQKNDEVITLLKKNYK